jgi:hypothetical protein
MDAVLPRIQTEVNAASQEPGLETSLTVPRNNLSLTERAFAAPDFFNDADVGVRDVNNAEQPRQAKQGYKDLRATNSPFCDWKLKEAVLVISNSFFNCR